MNVSQQAKPRHLLGFAISVVIVAVAVLAAAAGYFSSACPESSSGAGWAVVWVIFTPIMYPASILLWPAMSFALARGVKPASSSRRFAIVCMASVAAIPVMVACGWLLARVTDASARCSFGF